MLHGAEVSLENRSEVSSIALNKLADFSLEALLNMEVTSVAKKEQKLSESAAAVYVVGQEELRRSGVYWDVLDTMMEDIDRIEVVRGPGASLWGANAVNGVVNIITKSAKETQGCLVSGGGGTEERGFGGARYGGQIGSNAYYRVYGKYFNRDRSVVGDGSPANDAWVMALGGFRIDWDVNDKKQITLFILSESAEQ